VSKPKKASGIRSSVKIAVLAPMPSAIERTATAVKTGERLRVLAA
jgi:hypothetical protein